MRCSDRACKTVREGNFLTKSYALNIKRWLKMDAVVVILHKEAANKNQLKADEALVIQMHSRHP